MIKTNLRWVKIVSLLSFLSMIGCVVEAKKGENPGDKDGSVVTPVGSVSVATKGTAEDMGIKSYPGATLKPDTSADHNSNNANFNVSSPLFGLKLIVQKYETSDSQDKVVKFYEKELSKFGKVVVCERGNSTAVENHEKDHPVACDNSDTTEEYKTELKVGTERNQHIVAVKPKGDGASFALVYVRVRGSGEKE